MDYNTLSIADLAEQIRSLQTSDQVPDLQKAVDYRLHLPQLRHALFDRLTGLLQDQTQPVNVASDVEKLTYVLDKSGHELGLFSPAVATSATSADSVEQDEEERVSGLSGLHKGTANSVQQDGISYDLSQWVTFSEYMQHHGLKSTNIINNWINRGTVPPDCIVTLHKLNDLKLIRNQPYRTIPTG